MSDGLGDVLSRSRLDRGLQPVAVARSLDEALPFPSFAEYMDLVQHDPEVGYYGSGAVRFGLLDDYWTFPHMLGGSFAAMVAEAALSLLEEMRGAGALPDDAPLSLLELGGGDGTLGEALCDYVEAHAVEARWAPFATRLRIVLGEVSPALRATQSQRLARHIGSGRAECRALDARRLRWDGPFYGVVHGNELITAFPCERLRFRSAGERPRRVHVVPLVAGADSPAAVVPAPEGLRGTLGAAGALDAESFAQLLRREGGGAQALRRTGVVLAELEVPLDLGWARGAAPPGLESCLARCTPLVADLGACALLPTELNFNPVLSKFAACLRALLVGPDRMGAAMFVDYGGTTRHCLDPRARSSHLRVYGPERSLMHRCRPYDDPGRTDITYDLDFNEMSRSAVDAGLRVVFYGHQRSLEAPPAELRPEDGPDELTSRVVARFRRAPGFQLAVLAPPSAGVQARRFGPSDPLDGLGLSTLRRVPATGLSAAVAGALRPGADPVAALAEVGLYDRRHEILAQLAQRNLLAAPGELAATPPAVRRAADVRMRWEGELVELTHRRSTRRILVDLDYVELLSQLARPWTVAELESRLRPQVGDEGWRRIETMLAQLVEHGLVLATGIDQAEAITEEAVELEHCRRLLADAVCLHAYEKALRCCVRHGDTVIDAGSGIGVLAMLAARAGAGLVLALDHMRLQRVVEAFIARNNLTGRVRFLPLGPDAMYELEADAVVSGRIGPLGHVEALVGLPHLAERVLRASGRLIPRAREVYVAPLADPERFAARVGLFEASVAGVDFSPLYSAALCHADSSQPISPSHLLAAPVGLGREELRSREGARERQVVFRLERDGPVDGLGLYFVLDLCDGVSIDTGFGMPDTHWHQTWVPLPRFHAAAGERFGLRLRLGVNEDNRVDLELHCGIVSGNRLDPDHRVRVTV
jgi:SAM-dependent MidA family methyltransferase